MTRKNINDNTTNDNNQQLVNYQKIQQERWNAERLSALPDHFIGQFNELVKELFCILGDREIYAQHKLDKIQGYYELLRKLSEGVEGMADLEKLFSQALLDLEVVANNHSNDLTQIHANDNIPKLFQTFTEIKLALPSPYLIASGKEEIEEGDDTEERIFDSHLTEIQWCVEFFKVLYLTVEQRMGNLEKIKNFFSKPSNQKDIETYLNIFNFIANEISHIGLDNKNIQRCREDLKILLTKLKMAQGESKAYNWEALSLQINNMLGALDQLANLVALDQSKLRKISFPIKLDAREIGSYQQVPPVDGNMMIRKDLEYIEITVKKPLNARILLKTDKATIKETDDAITYGFKISTRYIQDESPAERFGIHGAYTNFWNYIDNKNDIFTGVLSLIQFYGDLYFDDWADLTDRNSVIKINLFELGGFYERHLQVTKTLQEKLDQKVRYVLNVLNNAMNILKSYEHTSLLEGITFEEKMEIAETIEMVENFLIRYPDIVASHASFKQYDRRAGFRERSKVHYKELVEKYISLSFTYAEICESNGEGEQASEIYNKIIRVLSKDAEQYHKHLSRARYHLFMRHYIEEKTKGEEPPATAFLNALFLHCYTDSITPNLDSMYSLSDTPLDTQKYFNLALSELLNKDRNQFDATDLRVFYESLCTLMMLYTKEQLIDNPVFRLSEEEKGTLQNIIDRDLEGDLAAWEEYKKDYTWLYLEKTAPLLQWKDTEKFHAEYPNKKQALGWLIKLYDIHHRFLIQAVRNETTDFLKQKCQYSFDDEDLAFEDVDDLRCIYKKFEEPFEALSYYLCILFKSIPEDPSNDLQLSSNRYILNNNAVNGSTTFDDAESDINNNSAGLG